MLEIKSISPVIGVEITGIDLSTRLSLADRIAILNHYHNDQLLIFRNQHIDPVQFLEFASIFGVPTRSLSKFTLSDYPLIGIMSNEKINDEPRGVVVKEFLWHSDSYVRENPNKTTLLLCISAPLDGGETLFSNTRTIYDSLPIEMKLHIEGRKIIFKNINLTKPPVKHPIVRLNKTNGKKSLYVNKHNYLGVDGMNENEAEKLIDYLYNAIIAPGNIYTHQWKKGDLLVWDNPSTMHAPAPMPNTPRTLHRIIIKGDLPVR